MHPAIAPLPQRWSLSAFLVSAVTPGCVLNSEDLELREIACDSCLSAPRSGLSHSMWSSLGPHKFHSFLSFLFEDASRLLIPWPYLPRDKITGFFVTTSSSLLNYELDTNIFFFVPLEIKDFKTQVITHYSPSIYAFWDVLCSLPFSGIYFNILLSSLTKELFRKGNRNLLNVVDLE